jgi:hypothetical protein
MPRAAKTSIVVLETNVPFEPLIIRSGPTNKEVRGFVEEHHRRFLAGEYAGPSRDRRAYQIKSAKRYADETAYLEGDVGKAIKIEDLIQDESV